MTITLQTLTLASGMADDDSGLLGANNSLSARATILPDANYHDTIISDGATGYWRCDECEGNTIANEVSGGGDLTATAGLWSEGDGPRKSVPGAAYGDGDDSAGRAFITTDQDGVDVDWTTDFGVECWFRLDDSETSNGFLVSKETSDDYSFRLYIDTALERIWATFSGGPATGENLNFDFTSVWEFENDDNAWHHLVFNYDATAGSLLNCECFMDGTDISGTIAVSGTLTADFNNAGSWSVAGRASTNVDPIRGAIRDVAIYNGAKVTSVEASDHYSKGTADVTQQADVDFDLVLSQAGYYDGADVLGVLVPGHLGRFQDATDDFNHTEVFVSVNGSLFTEVEPNRELASSIAAAAGATVTVRIRFHLSSSFDSQLLPHVGDGNGPTLILDGDLTNPNPITVVG